MTSFLEFFQTTVGAITHEKRPLVDMDAMTSIRSAMIKFNQERVSTIPIFKPALPTSEPTLCYGGRCYIGMISMTDIVVYIMGFASSIIAQEGSGKTVQECLNDPVEAVIGCSRESGVYFGMSVTYEDAPLSSVVDSMCVGKRIATYKNSPDCRAYRTGMHRCLICGTSGQPPRVLTQTDIVKFFLANVGVHPQISVALSRAVGSISHSTELVSVFEYSPVMRAFEKMQTLSALAVVNLSGISEAL